MELSGAEIADIGAKAALERKAKDVIVLNLKGLSSVTDFFVICTGTSDTHAEGIAQLIEDKLDEHNVKLWHREGMKKASWILLDYIDVMIHIFTKDTREFYGLEKLWGDAPRTEYVEDKD
ncbi:MAG: ribosome silencing factor [bacterium]